MGSLFETTPPRLHPKWKQIESKNELRSIENSSHTKPSVIFKHSTRCGISSSAKRRLEKEMDKVGDSIDVWYLDLLAHRDVSNQIATNYQIQHESPQIIVLRNGAAVAHASHDRVSLQMALDAL